MSDDGIKFTYGKVKAQLSQDGKKLIFESDTNNTKARNNLRSGLINIFNAIKKLEEDDKAIDTAQETQLLSKLQSIFQAGDSNTINDDELNWAKSFQAGGDVVEFINRKYNQVVGAQQPPQQGNNNGEVVVHGQQEQQQPLTPVVIPNGEKINLTERPDMSGYTAENYSNENGDSIYTVYSPNDTGDILYEPIINTDLDGDGSLFPMLTRTPEDAIALKERVEAELAKIQEPQENETDEAKTARMTQNMEAIENVAALANYDKNTLLAIIDKYITDGDYVDPKSPEYNSFVRRLLDTRDADVVQRLDLLQYNRNNEMEYDIFRGNEDTFKMLAALYKEIRDKEHRGEPLSESEKELKSYFADYEVNCGYRYDVDLRMVYDGNGDFRYQGKPYGFDHGSDADPSYTYGGINVIAGTTEEIVRNFQNDYTEACEAIAKASEGDEDQVEEAQFRALIHKYVNTTDDSFACSVLTSKLLKYADIDDIKTAINANGAEYLKYLECALEREGCEAFGLESDGINEIRRAMVNRAIEIYTHEEKGNVSNMLHLKGITDLINKTAFTEDMFDSENYSIQEQKIDEIVSSYFYRTENGELVYQGRRMTEEEIKTFCYAIQYCVNSSEYVTAIYNKFGDQPEVRRAIFKILDSCDDISDEIRISLIKDYMTENEDGTYSFNNEAYDDAFDNHSFIYAALPSRKIDITSNPEELSGNEAEYQKIWNAVFNMTSFDEGWMNWFELKSSLLDDTDWVPRIDPDTGEQMINPDTGEPLYDLEVNQENLLEFDRRFFEKLQNNLTPNNTIDAMNILNELGYAYEPMDELRLIAQLKNETAEMAIVRLAEDPTKEKIDNTIAIINSLKVDTGSFQDKAKPTVAAAIAKLQENPDHEMLRSLIKFCQKLAPDTTYNIMLELDISDCKDDIKKAMQTVMFESYISLREEPVVGNDVIENGWMTKTKTITSYNKGRTISASKNMYRMGDHELEFDDNKLKQRSVKGIQAGLDILDGIKGWNTADGPQHRKAREALDYINKDSVVDTILAFNEASSNYSDGTRIMEYLDGEYRGMTVESMIKVPEALIAWGQENGKDISTLQTLIELAKADGLDANSFPRGIAKQLDDAMLELINS